MTTAAENNRPAAVTVPTTDEYVSTLNIHKPEILDKLIKRYNTRNMTILFTQIGQMEPVSQTSFMHNEEDFIDEYIKVDADVASPGTGNPITITLSSEDYDASGKYSYPQEKELVMFPNDVRGQITVKDTSVDFAHTLTIQPLKATQNIGAVKANSIVIIYSNAWPEMSDQPDSRTPKTIQLSGIVQNIKRSYKVSGSEATNQIWFTVTDPQSGEKSNKWYLKGEADTYFKFTNDLEMANLIGQTMTNTTLTNAGMRSTEGLLSFVENNQGIKHNTGGPGFFSLPQLDSIIDKLDKNMASKENTGWFGLPLRTNTDNFINTAMQNGAITYGAFNGQKEIAIAFGFSSIHRSGYTFHLKTYDVYNHPKLLGAKGFDYGNNGLIIPDEPVWITSNGEKVRQKPVVIRYKAKDAYTRDMEHWLEGTVLVKVKTGTNDSCRSHYRAERGLEGCSPNKFVIIDGRS